MQINGVTLELDVFEAETAEKLEAGLLAVQSACTQPQAETSAADIIRTQCGVIFALFDTLFGAGTAQTLFGDKASLSAALDAFDALIGEINRQKEAMQQRTANYRTARTVL